MDFATASDFGIDFLYPDNSPADNSGVGTSTGCSDKDNPTFSGSGMLIIDILGMAFLDLYQYGDCELLKRKG